MSALTALYELLIAAHVAANLVWIGSISSVALVLVSRVGDGRVNAQLAHELYRKLSIPAFGISFLTAITRLGLGYELYFLGPKKFMHGKLLFAVIVIVLHHVIGGRAKAVAQGRRSTPGPVGVLGVLLLIAAVAATLFVVLKPF